MSLSKSGYADEAPELIGRFENISSAEVHAPIRHLLPTAPCSILDLGSGTGRDAAWFASMGHRVVAAEPVEPLRLAAMSLHRSPMIEHVDDGLPELAVLLSRGQTFDCVMLTGVWSHLDKAERVRAMPNMARLLRPEGLLIMSIRHGPAPAARPTFEASADEALALAAREGLTPILNLESASVQACNQAAGVTWTRLALRRAGLP